MNQVGRSAGKGYTNDEASLHETGVAKTGAVTVPYPFQLLTTDPRVVLSLASRPLRRERVLVQGADDETMLLDLDGGTYFALNEVGARVWELCDGQRSVADIATILIDEYDAPDEVIERDVLDLLTELEAEQLVIAG